MRCCRVSILVAVLAAFGVMSKQNEITAFKACGVSLYRLAVPVLLGSTLLSGGLFAFDFYYVANANRKQDALRDEIKGRATQTYLKPDRKWIMGYNSSRIFNYKYFDNSGEESSMNEASVFELEPKTFRLARQTYARRAHWSASLKTWVFEDGWTCEYKGAFCNVYTPFQATTFRELTEPPDYFLKEDAAGHADELPAARPLHTGPARRAASKAPSSCRCGSTASSPCRCSRS